tara:strand:- start:87 stop:1130 length:1044 start_codon:yes stop_codon:yes gene_type:complete
MKFEKSITVEKFINEALYNKKKGFYNKKNPFGHKGDFITSPGISSLFSEMIGIWIISYWEKLGKPKNLNVIELGPGDGSLCKIILKVFAKFPEFNKSVRIFLHEKSELLKKIQERNISSRKIKWIDDFEVIKKGPVVFFGNEFFDALPIKQYEIKGKKVFERFLDFNKNDSPQIKLKKVDSKTIGILKKFGLLRFDGLIEYPNIGLKKLDAIVKKIIKHSGGILLVDYGYLKDRSGNSLQSVFKHKYNNLFKNIGDADITSLVNFSLLKKYFNSKKLITNKVVTQGYFLKKLGILQRAEIISRGMTFKEKTDLYYRLDRLLNPKNMGENFKVLFAQKKREKFSLGFS